MSIIKDSPPRTLLQGESLKLIIAAAIYFLAFWFAPTAFASSAVVINEFVPDGNPEWVEFYNASASAEYLKNYYIDDDTSFTQDGGSYGSTKKILTNLNINNPTYPYLELPSAIFNNDGDQIVLFDSSGAIADQYSYSNSPGKEISIGRNPDNTGTFFTLINPTKGNTNSSPQPSATPSPTPILSPTSTPKPTATATPVPTNTPTSTPITTSVLPSTDDNLSPQVLAEADEKSEPEVNLDIIDLTATAESEISSSPSPQPEKSGGKNLPVVIISAAGIILMLGGGLPLIWSEFKSRKK